MFSSFNSEQWTTRIKHSTTRQIRALRNALRNPAYTLARLRNADAHAEILALCDAELDLRRNLKSSLADIVPAPDLNLTKSTQAD